MDRLKIESISIRIWVVWAIKELHLFWLRFNVNLIEDLFNSRAFKVWRFLKLF
jgi:hypothetical protein